MIVVVKLVSLIGSETPEDDGPVEEELVLDDDDAQHQTTTPLLGNNLWYTVITVPRFGTNPKSNLISCRPNLSSYFLSNQLLQFVRRAEKPKRICPMRY